MSKFKKLLLEYSEKFNEGFPIFLVMGMSDEDVKRIIKDSIRTGIKYKPKTVNGAIY